MTIAPAQEYIYDDIEVALLEQGEMDQAEFRAEQREERRKLCGSPGVRRNPITGQLNHFNLRCGLFRECDKCLAIRTKKHLTELRSEEDNMVVLKCGDIDAVSIANTIGKEFFRRYPVEGSNYLIISKQFVGSCTYGADSVEIVEGELSMDLMKELVNTPAGRRTSGKLGRKERVEKDDRIQIKVSNIVTSADYRASILAEEVVQQKTKHFDPKTIDEIEEAIAERDELYKETIEKAGYKVLICDIAFEYVDEEEIKRIDWIKSYNSRFSNRKIITYS